MPFHKEISCHFGNIAAHLHQGTWRWMHGSDKMALQNIIPKSLLKKAQIFIDSLLKNIPVRKIYLAKLSQGDKLNQFSRNLHEHFSRSTLPSSKIDSFLSNKIVVIGIDSLMNENLSLDNDYTLIVTKDISAVPAKIVSLINKYTSSCIVFNEKTKVILQMHNVKVNILVKELFYLPVKRDFSEESVVMDDFSIGIFSDLSKRDLHRIQQIRNSVLNNEKTYRLYVFHSRQNPGTPPKGLNYVSMNSRKLSEKLNHLSVFLNFDYTPDNIQLLETSLYLGIPCITCNCSSRIYIHLLKFVILCDEAANSEIGLANAFQILKKDYPKYNRRSLSASKYIEDRFSIERKGYEILKAIMAP